MKLCLEDIMAKLGAPRFQILHKGEVIGTSTLETGDAPMGCAEGVFYPHVGFVEFRGSTLPEQDDDLMLKRWIGLSVAMSDGSLISCLDVVLFEADFGTHRELRVDVLGIAYSLYDDLFPEHVRQYEEQFK